jgi:Domain of unknown function (DUF4386)
MKNEYEQRKSPGDKQNERSDCRGAFYHRDRNRRHCRHHGKPILDAPDYLTNISANESQIIIVTFLVFLMGVACAGIGLALYPIMRKYSTGLAIGVVGFRVTEGIFEILSGVSTVGLLALSQEFVKAGAPEAAYFQTNGAIIKAGDEWLGNGAYLPCWCICQQRV